MDEIYRKNYYSGHIFQGKERKPFFSKIGISFVFIFLGFCLFFPQIAGATIYRSGETLEPDCAPGSVNCGVATFPATLGTDTPIGNSLFTIQATSTDSILATLRAFAGQTANLFQIQDSGGVNLFSVGPSGGLTLSSFNGPLQANNGLISATTSIGVIYGGTGTTDGSITGNAATVTTNANLTGVITSVGNATSLGSFTSVNLSGALTDETGSGAAVFATSPTLTTPALGTPSALVGTNITGTAAGLSIGGNANTATALQTARTINGVSFDGTSNIVITAVADAGTLTGTTLAPNVVNSSLTSVGALSSGSIATGFGTIATTNSITTSDNISTTGTGTISSAGLLTASDGLTLSAGALNLNATSGTLNLSGLSASSLSTGANTWTVTSGNFNTTASGINATAIGATTAATGAFTGLSSSGISNIGSGTGVVTLNSSGALGLTGAAASTWSLGANALTLTASNFNVSSVGVVTLAGGQAVDLTTPAATPLAIDSGTTGGINIGTSANAKTINLGTGAGVVETINIGGSGANVISVGNTQTAGSVAIGAAMTTGTVTIGGTGAQTGALTFGGGTGAQIVNLGTGGTGVKTVNLATGSAANVISVGTGQTGGSFTLGTLMTTGTITIGGIGAQTGTISFGGGTGAQTVNLGTGGTGVKTVNLGTGTAANVISVGTGQTAGSISLGTAMTTGTISIGGTGAQTGTITFGGGTGAQTVNLGTGGTGIKTVHIGDGAAANVVTLGTLTGAGATNIQAGTGNVNMQVAGAGTTGNVQIGAGGAGSATPDLLVTDIKSTAGDPTGTNGAMYYNSNTNRFRCFQNGAWANCIGGDKQTILKTTDQSVTANTTLTSDTALTFAVGSGETWVFNFFLFVTNTNSAGPDFKAAVLGAAGWTCSAQLSGSEANGAAFPQAVSTDCDDVPTAMVNGAIGADGSNGFNVRIQGFITTTSAGAVTLQFAQNTSNAAALTVKGGSYVQAFKVGGADLAEMYYSKESLTPGTVVSIDPGILSGVTKSTGSHDKNLLGIVTTNPGMVLGDNNAPSGVPVLVSLSGRTPVNVSTENGNVRIGDYLTSSSIPGVAMKANGMGPIIGQAMSAYDGEGTGTVVVFVKNFDLGGIGEISVLMGDISPVVNADGSDNGLSTLITTIQSETARKPVMIIGKKITDGKQFLTDFVSARVTAIRGYFDEVFAKKVHTEEICAKKSDGNEVCVSGDELSSLLHGALGTTGTVGATTTSVVVATTTPPTTTTLTVPGSGDTTSTTSTTATTSTETNAGNSATTTPPVDSATGATDPVPNTTDPLTPTPPTIPIPSEETVVPAPTIINPEPTLPETPEQVTPPTTDATP